MAKTLLDGVNEVLKKASIINGDTEEFSSLTDAAQQPNIDLAVQVINEGIDELYSIDGIPRGQESKEGTITLATGTRAYDLASDLVILRWPLIDRTNSQFISEYPTGYDGLLLIDVPQTATGLPMWAAIRPSDGKLLMERAPTSVENGRVYYYQYDRDTVLSAASDAMPFSDFVFRAMVAVWHQLWKRERRKEFDAQMFKASLARAARGLSQGEPRDNWSPLAPRLIYKTDPFEA